MRLIVPNMSASSSPSLIDLATQISQAPEQIDAFLVKNGRPLPSFNRDATPAFPEAPAPVQAARQQILERFSGDVRCAGRTS